MPMSHLVEDNSQNTTNHNEKPVEIREHGAVAVLTQKEIREEEARAIIRLHLIERDGISVADALRGTKNYDLDIFFLPHELRQIGLEKQIRRGSLGGLPVTYNGYVAQMTRLIKAIPEIMPYADILSGLKL